MFCCACPLPLNDRTISAAEASTPKRVAFFIGSSTDGSFRAGKPYRYGVAGLRQLRSRAAMSFATRGRVALEGSSLLREAVEQTVAAGGDQVRLAAAARHVRRIPGALEHGVRPAAPIDVPHRSTAEGAARPVVACEIHVAGPGGAVHLRAGQHVMPVRRHAEAGHLGAALG